MGSPREHRVAIVGMGPRGFYCLERLVAVFAAQPLRRPLHVAVFNRSGDFGASPVYDPAQPDFVLLNVSVGEVDLWAAEDPPVVATGGLDFVAWHRERVPSAGPLTGEEYLPRAMVGRYLVDGFRRVLEQLPAGVTVSRHVGEVLDVEPVAGAYRVHVATGAGTASTWADKVMLSTGHSWLEPGAQERRWEEFAAAHDHTRFVPFVYPVEERLSPIPSGATVAMLGIGLTFVDGVLALTEGRGGRFERDAGGALAYRPSGREPGVIVPFSRTGLPMAPQAQDRPSTVRSLEVLTPRLLDELQRAAPGGKLDLNRDVWPLVEAEMQRAYDRVARDSGIQFDYQRALDPAAGRRFADGAAFHAFVERTMEEEIARARLGQAGCGLEAAFELWYEIRGALGVILAYGGFTPRSHEQLVAEIFPRFKRVAFGPPIVNSEKLLALVRAGVLDFSVARRPRVALDRSGCYVLRSRAIRGTCVRARALVDARYPGVDVARDATPLFRNLRRRGMIRAFENRAPGASYRPGAIDMTEPSRFLVGETGAGNEDIAVIGIPTEGNLVGNLSMSRDPFAGTWAADVLDQLRRREHAEDR